jgi:hypothetical protein
MKRHDPAVAARAGHRCEYCRAPEAIFNLPFEVEHIVPIARDGPDDESNLALACRACNLFKADQEAGREEQTGEVIRLFHPRRDRWEEHFHLDLDEAAIRGLTPVGRVTVTCLRMNRDVQREARRSWIRLIHKPADAVRFSAGIGAGFRVMGSGYRTASAGLCIRLDP